MGGERHGQCGWLCAVCLIACLCVCLCCLLFVFWLLLLLVVLVAYRGRVGPYGAPGQSSSNASAVACVQQFRVVLCKCIRCVARGAFAWRAFSAICISPFGVVRASVRRIAAVITIAIKHGQIRRIQIRKHAQGKEGAKWRVGLLLSRSRRCARRVQRGGHRIAIRAQRQNRRSALHSAVNHAFGRARSNRIKIQQECSISKHRTVFGVHHAIDLPRSRIRCLQCRAR